MVESAGVLNSASRGFEMLWSIHQFTQDQDLNVDMGKKNSKQKHQAFHVELPTRQGDLLMLTSLISASQFATAAPSCSSRSRDFAGPAGQWLVAVCRKFWWLKDVDLFYKTIKWEKHLEFVSEVVNAFAHEPVSW